MRQLRFLIIFGILGVTPATAVRASDAPWPAAQTSSSDMVSAAIDVLWTSSVASARLPLQRPLEPTTAPDNAAVVREIGAPPSSAVLFLSAFLSLGLWQVARSSRDLNLAHLPDWYHTGGPVQVGHATPFDLDFSSLLPCPFEDVNDGHQEAAIPAYCTCSESLVPQCLHASVLGPRAPPVQTL